MSNNTEHGFRVDKAWIQKAQKREVEELRLSLCSDIDKIDAQLMFEHDSDRPSGWSKSAKIARKHKTQALRFCRDRIRVIGREEQELKPVNLSKAGKLELSKSLDRAIIEEIRILVEPAEFLECIDRAKLKVNYESQLQELRVVAKA